MQSKLLENLKRSGLRITPIRKQLVVLFESSTKPLSAADILSKVKANKTTIYREIYALLKTQHLIEVNFGDGIKRYEFSGSNHHHHLICLNCHDVQDISLDERLSKEESLIEKTKKFKVMKHSLEFFGYCHHCV